MTIYKVFLQTETNNDLLIFNTIDTALDFAENTEKNNIYVTFIAVYKMIPSEKTGVYYNRECIYQQGTYNKDITTWYDDII